jgi:hypothetical protein
MTIPIHSLCARDVAAEPTAVRIAMFYALGWRPVAGRWMPAQVGRVWS